MERGWKKLESERAIIGNSDQVIVIRSGTEETSKVTCTFRRYQARREIGQRHKRLVGACSVSVEISLSLIRTPNWKYCLCTDRAKKNPTFALFILNRACYGTCYRLIIWGNERNSVPILCNVPKNILIFKFIESIYNELFQNQIHRLNIIIVNIF